MFTCFVFYVSFIFTPVSPLGVVSVKWFSSHGEKSRWVFNWSAIAKVSPGPNIQSVAYNMTWLTIMTHWKSLLIISMWFTILTHRPFFYCYFCERITQLWVAKSHFCGKVRSKEVDTTWWAERQSLAVSVGSPYTHYAHYTLSVSVSELIMTT